MNFRARRAPQIIVAKHEVASTQRAQTTTASHNLENKRFLRQIEHDTPEMLWFFFLFALDT